MFLFLLLPALLLLGIFIVFFPLVPILLVAAVGFVIYRVAAAHHQAQHGLRSH